MDFDDINRFKAKKKKFKNKNKSMNQFFWKLLSKTLICTLITISTMIILKSNPTYKTKFYKLVYEDNISFASINNIYKKYFGSALPFETFFKEPDITVFNEQLKYSETNIYKEGVKLTVDNNYLVPSNNDGLIIFTGDKDDYGYTIIVQQSDGVDVWYGNIKETNVKLYDYIDKGSLLGEVNDNYLYIVFKKNGEVIDYKEYIS